MFDIPNVGLFVGASLVLLMVPGPAVLYIIARSATQGRRAGIVSVAGIHVGTTVHIAAAILGLSAIIATSATAFTVVKLAGAAYLVYLGIRTIREGSKVIDRQAADIRSLRRVFVDGAIVNALNPKTALFFLAFVPQFVDQSRGDATIQLIGLGLVFTVLGIITDGAYALGAGAMGSWLRKRPRVEARQHWASGTAYLGLGITAAVSART